ncbi:MAG: TonB-dependent receptor [Xanthomonadales bacterium]|nr:TonB-dependent receptor [Xanthomonadales bacterium]
MKTIAPPRRGIQRVRLTLAILIGLQMQSLALAQTPEPPTDAEPDAEAAQLDEVVVTYRASLNAALDVKRNEVGQVDVILAEDVGKFPDLNLAESLQRIPGVAITRDAGEGRNISVRGLGPQFTRIRVNGLEALTTGGGTDASGGANRDRGFDFNVFASELFNSITVRKTSTAAIDEGSLGATVDLQTARPFDYPGFTAVGSVQGSYSDLSGDWNPRTALLLSNTWNDGQFGALLSIAHTRRDLVEEGHSTVRWSNATANGNFAASSPFSAARGATVFHPRLPRYGVIEHAQERLGVTGALQFQASDQTLISLDVLYADFDAERSENFLQAQSFSRAGNGKPQTVVREGAVDSRNNLVYGVFDNVDLRSESRYDELSTRFTQFNLSLQHDFNESLRLDALLGRSESRFRNPIQTTITIDRANSNGYSWDYRGNDRLPLINPGFDVTNPANWSWLTTAPNSQGSEIRLRPQTADNGFRTARFDLTWNANEIWTLSGGLSWKDYEFVTTELRRRSETTVPALPAGASLSSLTRLIGLNGIRVPAGTPQSWLVPDVNGFAGLLDIYCNCGTFELTVDGARGNNREVGEESLGGYLQADFASELLGRGFYGSFGVRHVRTEQRSTGIGLINNVAATIEVEREYSNTLPSMNLSWELTEDLLLRFGAAKVMARPGLGNLSPGVNINIAGSARTVAGQNPQLDPFKATTYDLGFEWYFAPESVLSLALFYKDIDSFVQTTRQTGTFEQNPFGLPISLLPTGVSAQDSFEFTFPVNTPGGPLKGYEFSYQQPLSFLPGVFSDFGLQLNYTYVDSQIDYLTATGALAAQAQLTGLSKNAYNATLYYEDDRFSARVSLSNRDDYLTTIPGRDGNDVEGTKGTTTVDASASWKVNDQLELTFEGLNLTDEANDQYVDSFGDRASVYHQTGRVYLIGARYKF